MPLLRANPLRAALLGCALASALSLLWLDKPTYDPTAWLIWGRQISDGFLETIAGPSWKPLPVLVTAPAALLGDEPAPLLWLFVARTGGLTAVCLIAALAARLASAAPMVAGAIAATALVLANSYVSGVVRGNSEGLLVAFAAAAVLAQLDGRARLAFALGTGAALLRPEAWPVVALHGLWLGRRDRSRATWLGIGAAAVLVLALWFVPEKIGSGDFLRGASRAQEPVEGSPAQSAFPFGAVFTNSVDALAYPVYAGALLGVVAAVRRRSLPTLAVAAIATAWMLAVAALAQKGFTGNLRYVTLPAALLCALAGAGWTTLARAPRAGLVAAAAALASLPGIAGAVDGLADTSRVVAEDERVLDELPHVLARAGGAAAVRACGHVVTGPFQVQAVAWQLHLRGRQVGLDPQPPGTIVARRALRIASDERFQERVRTARWVLRQSC